VPAGKSYVGIKLVQLLLHNSQATWDRAARQVPVIGPVVCICFTNHALDQFLEGLVRSGIEDGIVRVGGRSKSELLERFNLHLLVRDARSAHQGYLAANAHRYRR
jgi:hypothetical protein